MNVFSRVREFIRSIDRGISGLDDWLTGSGPKPKWLGKWGVPPAKQFQTFDDILEDYRTTQTRYASVDEMMDAYRRTGTIESIPPEKKMTTKRIIWAWTALIALTGIFPPWSDRFGYPRGYAIIFWRGYHHVDLVRLAVQWLVISAVAGGLYLSRRADQ